MQLYEQLFQRSKTPTAAEAAEAGAEGRAEPSPVSTQQQEQQPQENAGVASSQNEDRESHEGLVSLVQSSVDSFFGLLYAKVDQSLGVSPVGQPGGARMPSAGGLGAAPTLRSEDQQPQGGGGEGSAAEELDPVALGGVVAAVQQLVSDIEALDPHVPQVSTRKAQEMGELSAGEGRRMDRHQDQKAECGVFAPLLLLSLSTVARRCNERGAAITAKRRNGREGRRREHALLYLVYTNGEGTKSVGYTAESRFPVPNEAQFFRFPSVRIVRHPIGAAGGEGEGIRTRIQEGTGTTA